MNVTSLSRVSPVSAFLIATLPVVAVAIIGGAVTAPNIPVWHAALLKPSFNPPNAVFGPVWSLLFGMMAYAFYRVLTGQPKVLQGAAVTAFGVQLALNCAWSFAFFGAHSPGLGLVVSIALWIGVLATMVLFWRLDRISGALFVPYLAWVGFATLLNAAIWRLN